MDNYYWDHSPQSQSGTLVFGFFASGAGNGSLQVNFDLSAQGASMVPEPESYAMLLAGLGLMGAVITPEREQERLNYYPSPLLSG